jgi:hypothetical protein
MINGIGNGYTLFVIFFVICFDFCVENQLLKLIYQLWTSQLIIVVTFILFVHEDIML